MAVTDREWSGVGRRVGVGAPDRALRARLGEPDAVERRGPIGRSGAAFDRDLRTACCREHRRSDNALGLVLALELAVLQPVFEERGVPEHLQAGR